MAGLYIHIPYCVKKCSYCDFVSFADDGSIDAYCAALIREFHLMQETSPTKRTFDTVFFGGGTPSLLSGKQMRRVLGALKKTFSVAPDAECSMECNPGTATAANLAAYREAGVNRLSVGLQSASDELLERIGRIHRYGQFRETFRLARDAGFQNINVDVMHGLPEQTERQYLDTLTAVCDLGTEHVSSYALILNEDTPLYRSVRRGETALPDADAVADMQDAGISYLESRGYRRYEISNFSKPAMECRHNLNYWENGEYLGFGVAAHSAVQTRDWTRYANVETLGEYFRLLNANRLPVRETLHLYAADEMFETVMLGLRTVQGVDRAAFTDRFGVGIEEAYPDAIVRLRENGWIAESDAYVALNAKGLDLQNRALQYFMK